MVLMERLRLAIERLLFRHSEGMPMVSGSMRTKCWSASRNVCGWSEMGFAFGSAYLDYAYIRGAYGLSGSEVVPRCPPPPCPVQAVSPATEVHCGELLLLLPQLVTATDNTSISASQPSFSMASPFAGTVIEIERSCPQLDDWLEAPRRPKRNRPRTDAPSRLARGPLGEGFLKRISPVRAYA